MLGLGLLAIALPLALCLRHGGEDHSAGSAVPAHHGGVEVADAVRTRSFWLYCLILAMVGISGAAVNLHFVPFLSSHAASAA